MTEFETALAAALIEQLLEWQAEGAKGAAPAPHVLAGFVAPVCERLAPRVAAAVEAAAESAFESSGEPIDRERWVRDAALAALRGAP